MALQTDITALIAAIDTVVTDGEIMHQIVHGDETVEVQTESGPRKSISREISQQMLASGIFADTAAGLAATVEGNHFSAVAIDDADYLVLYRHDTGAVATEVKRYPAADTLITGVAGALTSEQNALQHATAAALSETNATDAAAEAAASQVSTAADRVLAEQAAAAAQLAEGNAVAVVTGGTASLPAAAGMIPIADAKGVIDDSWLSYTIPALNAQYPGLNVVASCFYDTSKDSDGGAWIHRTAELSYGKEAVPSGRYHANQSWSTGDWVVGDWYYNNTNGNFFEVTAINELNNPTAVTPAIYRAGSAAFPAQALIVAEAGRVIIFDASGPELTMWMVSMVDVGYVLHGSSSRTTVTAINGLLCVGAASNGLVAINFVKDTATHFYYAALVAIFNAALDLRNTNAGWTTTSADPIVGNAVNYVAATVLSTAPTDSTTGLKVPTIAVATNDGLSLLRDDGNTWHLTETFNTDFNYFNFVKFVENDRLMFVQSYKSTADAGFVHVTDLLTSNISAKRNEPITALNGEFYSASQVLAHLAPMLGNSHTSTKAYQAWTAGNGVKAIGANNGLSLIHNNPATPAEGMTAYVTDKSNTGWMVGDCQLAALCETETGAIVETELVTNGTFDIDVSGWTASIGSIAASAGMLRSTRDASGYRATSDAVPVVPGKTYAVYYDYTAGTTTGDAVRITTSSDGSATGQVFQSAVHAISGTYRATFTATSSVIYFAFLGVNGSTGQYADWDNISIKQVAADRSGNGNHLEIIGTLNRAPIGNGVITAWSGFGSSNTLKIPYNPNFDVGTGDFFIKGWVFRDSTAGIRCLLSHYKLNGGSPADFSIRLQADQSLTVNGTGGAGLLSYPNFPTFGHMAIKRENGTLKLFVDGEFRSSYGYSADWNGVDASDITIGTLNVVGSEFPCIGVSIAELGFSKTAPTDAQIAKMYRDELAMIQGNAVLSGNDPDITALAYDKERDLLHAASSATVSSFRGLERIDSTTPAVGTISSLDAQDGALIVAGTTGVDVSIPAVSIRERLAQALPQPIGHSEDFYFTGDAVKSDFPLPRGWKPKRVWIDDGKVRKGSAEDYTIKSDGFVYSISFNTAPALNAEIDVEAVSV